MERVHVSNSSNNSTRNLMITALLAGILSAGVSSCGKTTQRDINEERQRVELLSFNISHCINERKKMVQKYNTILAYPRTEANRYEIDNHLCLLEEQIDDYDEKIRCFVKKKLDAEVELGEKIADRGVAGVHTPIDPNKRDYLLEIN